MTSEERRKLYAALSAPFPEECIERTSGRETGKGYDTAGVRAQFLMNRINEVCGVGCYRIHRTITVRQTTSPKGRALFEAICDMTVELGHWENGEFVVFAEALADGGHTAFAEADAKKGSTTNALKRALACFGIGKAAWEGTLDDDNLPLPSSEVPAHVQTQLQHSRRAPAPPTRTPHAPQPETAPSFVPPGYVASPEAPVHRPEARPQAGRNRVSSKQIAAVWSIARKLGLEQSSLRGQVKTQFGTVLEFLSREQASQLIDALNRKVAANGNGHASAPEQAGTNGHAS